jgi:hypothetical protein
MSQKSSLPQSANSVSQVLTPDSPELLWYVRVEQRDANYLSIA